MTDNDAPFTYESRRLADWLEDLIADDFRRREQAATAIQEIRFHPPQNVDTSAGAHAHLEAFDTAVRQAIGSAGFDAPAFLTRLIHLLKGSLPGQGRGANTQEAFTQSLAASFVFAALREELLLVADEIRAMLADSRQRWNAIQAIERLGTKGHVFADDLLSRLDTSESRRPFDAPDALAAVIHDDAQRVRAVVDRLDAAEPAVAEGAAETFYTLGLRATELAPDCIARLLTLSKREGSPARSAAITALGRVTQGTDVAVDELLSLSRHPENAVRGPALSALGEIGRQPERVVPRLIEALDDYQEHDADWLHYSQHERVVRGLQTFGLSAIPAVPALIARVRRDVDKLDTGVIETLAKLGPAAREALPSLERLAEDEGYTAEDYAHPEELDEEYDLVAVAVLRIRG